MEGTNVNLAWGAEADIESGIRSFDIYRDDAKVGSFSGDRDFFQGNDYGDEPAPVDPQMMFVDSNVPPGVHAYRIATANGSGLASAKSAPVSVTAN